jgi:hypothetical protein
MSTLSAAGTLYRIAFEVTPIILNNGIANLLGGVLPIVAITEGLNFVAGLLSGGKVAL